MSSMGRARKLEVAMHQEQAIGLRRAAQPVGRYGTPAEIRRIHGFVPQQRGNAMGCTLPGGKPAASNIAEKVSAVWPLVQLMRRCWGGSANLE